MDTCSQKKLSLRIIKIIKLILHYIDWTVKNSANHANIRMLVGL